MAGHHIGFKVIAQGLGQGNGVQKNSRLGDFRLTKGFFGAFKHDIGNAETQDGIGLFKQGLGGF